MITELQMRRLRVRAVTLTSPEPSPGGSLREALTVNLQASGQPSGSRGVPGLPSGLTSPQNEVQGPEFGMGVFLVLPAGLPSRPRCCPSQRPPELLGHLETPTGRELSLLSLPCALEPHPRLERSCRSPPRNHPCVLKMPSSQGQRSCPAPQRHGRSFSSVTLSSRPLCRCPCRAEPPHPASGGLPLRGPEPAGPAAGSHARAAAGTGYVMRPCQARPRDFVCFTLFQGVSSYHVSPPYSKEAQPGADSPLHPPWQRPRVDQRPCSEHDTELPLTSGALQLGLASWQNPGQAEFMQRVRDEREEGWGGITQWLIAEVLEL